MHLSGVLVAGVMALASGRVGAAADDVAKVSVPDLHFVSAGEAAVHCAGQPISAASDGGFSCPAPAAMAINEKGLPGTKTPKPASPK